MDKGCDKAGIRRQEAHDRPGFTRGQQRADDGRGVELHGRSYRASHLARPMGEESLIEQRIVEHLIYNR
jgi:hypothetical protein